MPQPMETNTVFTVMRRRDFGLLFAGQLVSQAGDYVLIVALPFWVYNLTGSAAATGLMFGALTLPQLVLSPVAGVFVDRWPHKTTMIVSDLLRGVLVLGLLTVRSADHVWVIYLLAFLESCVSRFFMPARTAALPLIVPRDRLTEANAALGFGEAVARLGGAGLGGVLVALWGPRGAALLDACSYLVSASVVALIVVPAVARGRAVTAGAGAALCGVWTEMRDGAHVVVQRPALRMVFRAFAVFMVPQGVINALLVVIVKDIWGAGSRELGWLMSAQGAGALVGGALVGAVASRVSPRTLMAIGGIINGLLILAIVNQPSIYAAIAIIPAAGLLFVGFLVGSETLLQLGSDDDNRGRVAALLSTISAAATLLGMGLTSALVDRTGALPLLDAAALLTTASGLVALWSHSSPVPSALPVVAEAEAYSTEMM